VPFALVAAAGIALRVWIYRGALGVPDSDEAIVGLMALQAMHGHLTNFYWGQGYGGPQEALLTVPVFWLFGVSWAALRLVPILISAAAALVLWRAGRRLFGEPAGAVAGALLWVWPPFALFKLTHQFGFYASGVFYCSLLLLLALRVVERPDRVRVGVFALVCGLAFWQTVQIVPIAAVLIVWIVWRRPRALRHAWVALAAGLLGALPWIAWNIAHDGASFAIPYGQFPYPHRLRLFFSPVLPMTLGLRVPFSQQAVPPSALVYPALALIVGLFGYGAWRARRSNAAVLYAIVAVFPFLYALSPLTSDSLEPRYTVVLSPILVLLVAQLATDYPRALLVLLAGCAVSFVVVDRMNTYFRTTPAPYPTAPRDLRPLVATLDRLHLDHVYADYWLAYVLDFDTHERIVAAQSRFGGVRFRGPNAIVSHDPVINWEAYEKEVGAAPRTGLVFFRPAVARTPLVKTIEQHGYRRTDVGPFVVFAPPT
jgi:4-amino-4-deoxy-L-arabinose transferase-like glycosyltransferase